SYRTLFKGVERLEQLKRTAIFPEYKKYNAKTIDFAGWELPVQFVGIKHEHEITRTKAGLFDVSHMGKIAVKGSKSLEFLQKVVTNDVAKLTPKRAQYTFMCYEDGGTVDDFLIYKLAENDYLLVVNAANTEKDIEWLDKHNDYDTNALTIADVTDRFVQLALQGPKAQMILQKLTETNLETIKFFHFENPVYFTNIQAEAIVSRTGYTGEDGFEIYIDKHYGLDLWNAILQAGESEGLEPVGLGARDTLRFEANLPLYGHELSPHITPVEAGLSFAIKPAKDADFPGRDKLQEQMENGSNRKLVGIEMIDKGIPRHGYPVLFADKEVGFVTSGTQAPTLKRNIGLALVQSAYTDVGCQLTIQVRKRKLAAKVIETPFLKKNP